MKIFNRIRLCITGLFFLVTTVMYSANRYWIATSTANWNTTASWSTTSGGASGASVPGSADLAIFDAAKVGSCTIDAAVNVAGIDVQTGYTGTISQGANAITVGTSNAIFTAGTFTGGSAAITINGTFTLAGAAFTSTTNTLTFNSTVTNTSGTFTISSGTITFNSASAQTIPAWNYNNLTSSSSGSRTLASSGTIGIKGTFTPGTNTYTITGSTVDFNGTSTQAIAAFDYNNLTISQSRGSRSITLAGSGTIGVFGIFSNTATFSTGGFVITGSTISYNGTGAQTIIAFNYENLTSASTGTRTLASSGTIGVKGSFTPGANTYTITGSTIDYNSTGAQTITAFNYNNLTVSGARTTNNVTLANSGTIGIASVFSNTATFTSGAYVITGSTISYNGTGAQTIIAFNYENLTSASTGTRTLASSGTIGVKGSFTPGTNTYTITGSTIDYNSGSTQSIAAFNYNNLTVSQYRDIKFVTLASTGTIGVAGIFSNTATFSTGAFVITGSTINYNGTGAQTVIAFNYNSLTISGAHTTNNITLASSGTIAVAATFSYSATFTTGSPINTGSTIDFNGTTAQTITAFNYNNLTISGARGTNVNVTLASTGTIGIAGTFSNTVTFSGTGAYVNTGSTINYNGTGAQTIIAFNYYNLTLSGARTTNSITLAGSGTIGIAKIFSAFAVFTSGNYITTGSTVDFNGSLFQTIPAFSYNHLTSSSTGGRAFGSTGTVKIAGTFTKGSNAYTNVGSTGEGFTSQNSNATGNLLGAATVSASIAFVSGSAGAISKTTDGGTTWSAQTSTTTNDLYAIGFFDANNGLAVGNTGTIVKTSNGGTSWAVQTSGTTQNLRAVTYASSTVAFACGANGVILKSTNGGTTWAATTTGTTQTMYAFYFSDANTGYASGFSGTILKTTNGGTNWSALTSGTSEAIYSLKFTGTLVGYGAGTNGKIIKTTDAGVTWTALTSGTSDNLSAVAFYDVNNGYIAGGNITNNTGTILKTTNGGATWSAIYPGTTRLTAMHILNQNVGFFAGLDGNIAKYTCCTDGSTVDYNGTGAQNVVAANYHNLTLSGARTTNNITLASSGTIGISGTLLNTATFSSGSIVNTSSTIDLNGSIVQTVPAFTFNNLTLSSTGKKSVTGALTVQGNLVLTDAEIALAGNTLTMGSNAYTVITRTKGYVSTTGAGYLRRPTASMSNYIFPIGYRTTNDSTDLFSITLTPGKTAAQQFDASLHSANTGFVLNYDRTMYGIGTGGVTTVVLSITTSSYNPLELRYTIDNNANITAVNVLDQNDNTLKTLPSGFYTITSGSSLSVPNIYQLCLIYSKAILNSNMNWTYKISYDGNGYPVSEAIKYSDLLGRPTQTQMRNLADNTVLASQTVYDNYGRAALQTLPAPIGSAMNYQNNFISDNTNTPYSYLNFDVSTKLNSPDVVQTIIPGTLGAYYSDNSTEAFVATTSYPYARAEFTSDPGGSAKRNAMAGDEYRMGAGHETKTYSMVSGDELRYIFGTDKSFKSSIDAVNKLVNSAITVTGGIKAGKSIAIDADGKEVVNYDVGGLPIASCYTGITGACTMTAITNTMVYAGTSSVDIHIPSANKTSLNIPLPQYYFSGWVTLHADDITFKITDLNTNTVLVSGTDYTINAGTRAVTFLGGYATGSSVFRISFTYSQTKLDYFAANSIAIPDASLTYALDYSRWSVNYYDLRGQLRKSVSQKGINCSSAGTITMATTYNYSSKGQLVASLSPDAGLSEATYDEEGKARFSQTAEQRTANKFSYINYDVHGRAMETGEYSSSNNGSASVFFQNYYGAYSAPYASNTPSASIINHTDNTGMRVLDCNDKNNIYYYPLATAEDIPAGYTYKSSYSARYLMGKVCKTKNAQSATWYGYNQVGQTMFTVQQLFDADYITYNATTDLQIKTVDYTYSAFNGTLTDQTYQKNGTTEKLKHNFTYDNALRLTQVDVSIEGATAVPQAKYYYYKTGAPKRKELGDKLQGVDYVYTINGALKSINHPALDTIKDPGQDGLAGSTNAAFGKDVFGLTLDYHTSDYTRTGSNMNTGGQSVNLYNGMISASHYKTRAVTNSVNNGGHYIDYGGANQQTIITGVTEEIMNQYTYDDEYRLSTVGFGKFNNSTFAYTVNGNACYKEYGTSGASGINYDANGNITTLKRNGYITTGGILMDDLAYTYTSNTNKLASIVDAGAAGTYATDFDAATSKTFTYNSNAQMTASQAEGVSTITYYNTGLTKKVSFSNSNYAEYWYDDRGQKIKTRFFNYSSLKSKFTWYISDAGGNPLAIYEYDSTLASPAFTLAEEQIYGSGRIGTLDKVTGIIDYEMTDHLGNVRATIKGISTGVYELTTRTDYYAFGGAQPGRSYNLNAYRFNYQGQEGAPGTNWQAFDLRMLNSDLGRWFAPDPYGQFHSPYISMGNNPVSGIDPNGGYSFNNIPSTMPGYIFAMEAARHSYRSSSFYYEGEYRKGFEIEQMRWRDYGYRQFQDRLKFFSTEATPKFRINHATFMYTSSAPGKYIVTDPLGNEHISFTAEGAEALADEFGIVMQDYRAGGDGNGNIVEGTEIPIGDPYFVSGTITEAPANQDPRPDINTFDLEGSQYLSTTTNNFTTLPGLTGVSLDSPWFKNKNKKEQDRLKAGPSLGLNQSNQTFGINANFTSAVGRREETDWFEKNWEKNSLDPTRLYFLFMEGGLTGDNEVHYGSIPASSRPPWWPN